MAEALILDHFVFRCVYCKRRIRVRMLGGNGNRKEQEPPTCECGGPTYLVKAVAKRPAKFGREINH